MKLRVKIFLLVGFLFFTGFLLSFFLEEAETRRQISMAEQSLKKELVTGFFQDDLRQFNYESESLLRHIEEHGCNKITELAGGEKLVNLLYNPNNIKTPVSIAIFDANDIYSVTKADIDDNQFIFIVDHHTMDYLCVGIEVGTNQVLLFPLQDFMNNLWANLPDTFKEKAKELHENLSQSKLVEELSTNLSYQRLWIQKHKEEQVRFQDHKKVQLNVVSELEYIAYCYPSIKNQTIGLVEMVSDTSGIAMFNYDLDSTQPLFQEKTIAPETSKGLTISPISEGIVNLPKNTGPIYTLHVNCFLEKLALITNEETLLFVYNNEIIIGYDPHGIPIKDPQEYQGLTSFHTNQLYTDKHKNEYFIWSLDLFNTKEIKILVASKIHRGGVFDSVDASFDKLLEGFSLQLFVIFFSVFILFSVALNIIVGRIAKPISLLARSAKSVSEGSSVTSIKLPERKVKFKDEIDILYDTVKNMFKVLQDKDKLRSIFDKMVSPAVAERLISHGIELGGEEKKAVMLIADIRGFTKMTEHMTPQEMVSLLNECMTEIKLVINQFGGIVDKYVGDEVMVLFNVPEEMDQPELKACQCAQKMLQVLKVHNISRNIANKPEIHMGIGIHSGKVIAGNMGAEDRLNYTVIGSSVNLSSRLCDHAAPDEILISEEVYQKVSATLKAQEKEEITFKGFTQPIKIYSIEKE